MEGLRKRPSEFQLQYDPTDIPKLAAEYMASSIRGMTRAEDDQEMEEAGSRIVSGDLSLQNLRVIYRWKSHRRIGLLDKNTDAAIGQALKQAVCAKTIREAVDSLTCLDGVGVKMASAILTAIDSKRYTVLDILALQALGRENSESVTLYVRYVEACGSMAKKYGVTMRDLDRANWQWSKNKSKLGASATHCRR
jgi:hypothetical protein